MAIINWGTLYYTFGTSVINYEVAQNFRVLLNEKAKSNLKLPKGKILQVDNFFLFDFVFFYRQIVISKQVIFQRW